jgi:hypothetical protein
MKLLYPLLLTIVLSLDAEIASSQRGFIRRDSSYNQVKIVSQDDIQKSKEVKYYQQPGNKVVTLSPRDVIEYGFTGGDTYSRISVNDGDSTRLYFARRLTNDKLKLLTIRTKHGDRMFALSDDGLIELKNDDSFHSTLSATLRNCNQTPSWIREVRFRENSLRRAFSLNAVCYDGIFPRMRKGILAGYSSNSLTLTGAKGEHVSLGSSTSPFAGIFIDMPVGRWKPTWSINAQAYFQKSSFHVSNNSQTHVQEYIANTSYVNVPVFFKYHLTSGKMGRYLAFGLTTSYYFTRDSYNYDAVFSGSAVTEQKTIYNSISQWQIGTVLGAGLNFSVMNGNILNFEFQYQYGKGVAIGDSGTHSLSSVQLISSISF